MDSSDYLKRRRLADVVRGIERHVRPGSIVLLHDIQPRMRLVLRLLLPRLAARGFRLVSVPELRRVDPPAAAQLRAGFAGCAGGDVRRGE